MRKIFSIVIVLALALGIITPNVSYSTSITPPQIYISAGDYQGTVIKKDNSLWLFGWNEAGYGQLNTPIKVLDDVKMVSCSDLIAAVRNDGTLWVCGNGGAHEDAWLIKDWNPSAGVNGTDNLPKLTKIANDVKSVSVSEEIAYIKTDNSLWVWGWNDKAQIGNGYKGTKYTKSYDGFTVPVQSIPVKILDNVAEVSLGRGFGVALKIDGSVWTWGWNKRNQLGNGGTGDARTISTNELSSGPVQTVPTKIMEDVISIDAGDQHACAIKTDGTLWVWGIFETGNGRNFAVPTKIMNDVAQVSAGRFCTAIVKKDSSLWTCGNSNYLGVLGNGSYGKGYSAPTKIMDGVNSADINHSLAIMVKNDGSVWTCGLADSCGNGLKSNATTEYGDKLQTVPLKIMDVAKLAERASAPPPPPVDEPSSWAKPIMEKAITAGLVPASLQKDWQKPISRQETATLVVSFLEAKTGKNLNQILLENNVTIDILAFTDTKDYNVLAVNALDIVTGFPGGEFRPSGTLTRAQATVFVYNIARVLGYDTGDYNSAFSDTVNHWAAKFVGFAAEKGIVAGVGNNKFNPDGTLTKEQLIAILYSMFIML